MVSSTRLLEQSPATSLWFTCGFIRLGTASCSWPFRFPFVLKQGWLSRAYSLTYNLRSFPLVLKLFKFLKLHILYLPITNTGRNYWPPKTYQHLTNQPCLRFRKTPNKSPLAKHHHLKTMDFQPKIKKQQSFPSERNLKIIDIMINRTNTIDTSQDICLRPSLPSPSVMEQLARPELSTSTPAC